MLDELHWKVHLVKQKAEGGGGGGKEGDGGSDNNLEALVMLASEGKLGLSVLVETILLPGAGGLNQGRRSC